jgi:hypothetical protein
MTGPNEAREGLIVERYELDEGGFLGDPGKMEPDPMGDWVRFEDWLAQATEITRLRAEVERMREALDEAREFADDYSDVVDGSYGIPEPNAAMRLISTIDAARGTAK